MLLERQVRRVFDRNCWQRVTYFRPVAPAEYDAHCAAAKAAGATPSLRQACGDLRTGAQLLADASVDQRMMLARLCRSRRGRAWLGQLAGEVRQLFAPRVRAALVALAEDAELAALARMLEERPWPPDDGRGGIGSGVDS
jgi:hypothetical protein